MIGIGPVEFLTFLEDPLDPGASLNMLCGSLNGGLFYSEDGGENWSNSGSDLEWIYAGCKHAVFYPEVTINNIQPKVHWYAATSKYHGKLAGGHGGDNFVQSAPILYDGGIMRTQDGGVNWERIADWTDLDLDAALQKLLFDKKVNYQLANSLFVVTSKGIWKSEDPESSNPDWGSPLEIYAPASVTNAYPAPYSFEYPIYAHDLEYLPAENSTTLCAAVRFHGEDGSNSVEVWRFMRSDDDGDTWYEVPIQPADDPTNRHYTVEVSNAAASSFFCYIERAGSSSSEIFEYNIVSNTWMSKGAGISSDFGSGHAFGVDQFNANSIFVSTGTRFVWFLDGISLPTTYPYTIYTGHSDVEDIVGHPQNPNEIWFCDHGGVKKRTFDPIQQSWGPSEDKSNGIGIAEVTYLTSSRNVPDYVVTGLFHDHTVITRTPFAYSNWDPDWDDNISPGGDGTGCMMSADDPNILYTSWQGSKWYRYENATQTGSLSNENITLNPPRPYWGVGAIRIDDPYTLYRSAQVERGITQYTNNGTLTDYTNNEHEVYRSFDGGDSEELISYFGDRNEDPNNRDPDPTLCSYATGTSKRNAEMIGSIYSSPLNPDHLYISYRNWDWRYRMHRTTMANDPDAQLVKASWEWLPIPGNQKSGFVNGVAFDRDDENVIYLARSSTTATGPDPSTDPLANEMVFRMDYSDLSLYVDINNNGNLLQPNDQFNRDGLPCQDITMNLPNTFIHGDGLEYEKGTDGGIYIATQFGVYFTNNQRIADFNPTPPVDADDQNNTSGWVRVGDGFPHVPPSGMEINYIANRIRVGTYGRGTWEHNLQCPETDNFSEVGVYSNNEFFEARNTITSTAEVPNAVEVDYRAGEYVHMTSGFHAKAGSDFHAFIHPCDRGGNSFHYKDLEVNEEIPISRDKAGSVLNIYPNPNGGTFTVETIFDGQPTTEATLNVYDLTGRMVHTMR
ncbi:hypothetical protein DRQ25_17100, partial [Candidatus Fermentibacteria bacterium]